MPRKPVNSTFTSGNRVMSEAEWNALQDEIEQISDDAIVLRVWRPGKKE